VKKYAFNYEQTSANTIFNDSEKHHTEGLRNSEYPLLANLGYCMAPIFKNAT
jgi:hypothetical protein